MWEEQRKDDTSYDLQPQYTRKPQHQPHEEITGKQRPQEPHTTNSLIANEVQRTTSRCHPCRQQVKADIRHRWHK